MKLGDNIKTTVDDMFKMKFVDPMQVTGVACYILGFAQAIKQLYVITDDEHKEIVEYVIKTATTIADEKGWKLMIHNRG